MESERMEPDRAKRPYQKAPRATWRESYLPPDLDEPGIIKSGAIIVFNGDNRRVASYIPGTLWPGSLALPDDYLLDCLPRTSLEPRADFTGPRVVRAAQQLAIWNSVFGIQTRVLIVLDAIGGSYRGHHLQLAHVCGMSRERLCLRLHEMLLAGLIDRQRNGNQGDLFTLPAHARGTYWHASTPESNHARTALGVFDGVQSNSDAARKAVPKRIRIEHSTLNDHARAGAI